MIFTRYDLRIGGRAEYVMTGRGSGDVMQCMEDGLRAALPQLDAPRGELSPSVAH